MNFRERQNDSSHSSKRIFYVLCCKGDIQKVYLKVVNEREIDEREKSKGSKRKGRYPTTSDAGIEGTKGDEA